MRAWLPFIGLLIVAGCDPSEGSGPGEPRKEDPVTGSRWAVGFTGEGDLAVFDAESGAVVSTAPGSGKSGRRDVAVDAAKRVWVLEQEDEGGEIRGCPLAGSPPALGACAHWAWVDGVAALWPAPGGMVVFEDGYGPRWKVLRDDGAPAKGVWSPRPASVWGDGTTLHALTYGQDGAALERRSAAIGGAIVPSGTAPWGSPATEPPSARFTPLGDGGVLVDAQEGDVALRWVEDDVVGAAMLLGVGPGIARVEAAAGLEGAVIALTTDRAVIAAVENGTSVGAASVPLPEGVRREDLFFSRDLLVTGPARALVATEAGVVAIRVKRTAGGVTAFRDGQFAGLRGPLAAVPDLE
ncbi:hypothetical protein [Polyangium aurulentum]|uniref:hypothetical protein n=1 Tax=Polyangium aurulentum TaxID=2567896 RepID=UPI0010AEA8B3|nr:hypothetical protein [Polyangium aurulentum]UQA62047.1 hypothetical protein E8A73_016845 [Polyangium aurulentum]